MATYCNPHWLLCHIRNSFISTDDTGMCEAVMLSDDLPKQFLQRENIRKRLDSSTSCNNTTQDEKNEYLCYPGLEQSDDEDMDQSSQSFDIQMYPEICSHRYRSNTAQKLEKMDLARRRAARIKNIKFEDPMPQETSKNDIFVRKKISNIPASQISSSSLLTLHLQKYPKQPQNKFLHYARFDGTSQTGIPTKNISIFLTMLPENERNYPMKICVAANAIIEEVIGFICYKCSIINPDVPLQSVRDYGLYITEEDGEIDVDFPPLDLREPCSKFGFTHLTMAERRPSAHITRIDYRSLSMTSEAETIRDAATADQEILTSQLEGDMARMLGHNSMIEAPMYQTYRVNMIFKGFFKSEVQLGISGERIEIDPVQQKNPKFWTRQKAISYGIESIAYCEIVEQRSNKALLRIWCLHMPSQSNNFPHLFPDSPYIQKTSSISHGSHHNTQNIVGAASPQHYNLNNSSHYKYFDFETSVQLAQKILDKINFILEVRSSAARREFLLLKDKKRERSVKKFGK